MMKYLLVALIVALAFWIWRKDRRAVPSSRVDRQNSPTTSNTPQIMVQCPVCGVHLAQSDAVAGRKALYCGAAHRTQAEG
jgi:uncharacterized protein